MFVLTENSYEISLGKYRFLLTKPAMMFSDLTAGLCGLVHWHLQNYLRYLDTVEMLYLLFVIFIGY